MADKLNSQEIPSADETHEAENQAQAKETLTELAQNERTPRLQRSELRAAISSIYHTHAVTGPLTEPENKPLIQTIPETTPEEPEAEKAKKAAQLLTLLERAELLSHNGETERARQLYSQAVRLEPGNSEAWSGLGHLLVEQNPERARYCLNRALNLDSQNQLAKLTLEDLDKSEKPVLPVNSMALVRLEDTELAKGMETPAADGDSDSIEPGKRIAKIGLEEAIEIRRQKGVEADPEDIPTGGARFKAAIESGVLKPGRVRTRRRLPLPRISLSGLALSLSLLVALGLLSLVGMYFVIAQPSFDPPPPTATLPPLPPPTATLGIEEIFSIKIRSELEKYNRYLTNIKSLVDRQRANKVQWEEFRKGFDDLQKQLKDEKKAVDALAGSVQPKFLNIYRGLQDLAITSITGSDYMVSGIHNYEPDDLDEGLRQFSRANNQLADLAGQLNILAPLPTATPALTTVTPDTFNGAVPIVAPPNTGDILQTTPPLTTATPNETASPAATATVPATTPANVVPNPLNTTVAPETTATPAP